MHMVESMGPAGVMAATALAAQHQRDAAALPAPGAASSDEAAVRVVDDFKLFEG